MTKTERIAENNASPLAAWVNSAIIWIGVSYLPVRVRIVPEDAREGSQE